MKSWQNKLIFLVGILILWQVLYQLRFWPSYVFPSPLKVTTSLVNGFLDASYPIAILTSLRRLLIGYAFSLVIGIPLGMLLGRVKLFQDTIGTIVLGFQALPSICWLPLALLWFGLSDNAILFVTMMGALFSVTLSTADGVHNTPPIYLRVAQTMGVRGFLLYFRVILPSALPAILSGMKLGWSFAWRSLMAGELLYVSLGLGQLLSMGRELNDMSQVLAVIFVIITIGLITDRFIFGPAERRIRERWGLVRT